MQDIRIFYIGDSFVNGTGDPEKLGWCGRLSIAAQAHGREITHYNLGVRRETSSDILDRFESEVHRRLMEGSQIKIVFSFGVNDMVIEEGKTRVSLDKSIENTSTLLKTALQKGDVIMVGPPPIDDEQINGRIKTLDQSFDRLCHSLSVPYISVLEQLLQEPVWLDEVSKNDGAHPKSKGYEVLANIIASHQEWWY